MNPHLNPSPPWPLALLWPTSGKQLWVFDGPIAVVSVVPITAQKAKSVHPYP